MAIDIGRRKFVAALGGAAAAWPLAARAQQPERMRRIGVLSNMAADEPEGQTRLAAFVQGLQEAGWAVGRNVRIDIRWGAGDADLIHKYAADLVTLAPDVVLANANPCVDALQRVSRTIPIVFAATTDPVGSGFVESLPRPGGNTTGFATAEFGMSGKWLELLKEIAPSVKRVAVLQDAGAGSSSNAQFAAIQAVASSFNVDITSLALRDAPQIEQGITAFARSFNAGLIATQTGAAIRNHDLIIRLAAQLRLPAVYPLRLFVASGGLIAYGSDIVDEYRRAASYVDRILKGEKPADLPVQAPTKYELVINLKTAKALGLTIPQAVLARADEVIE